MGPASRRELAEAQAALARALLEGGPVPPGFDEARIRAVAESLAHKRLHAAARAWPQLSAALGTAWAARFAEHCAPRPLAVHHGPLCDGWWLAEALEAEGTLGDRPAVELLSVRLRFRRGDGGASPLGGWTWAHARTPRGTWWALRVGARVFTARTPWPHARPAPSPPPRPSSRSR
ncbi:MAG: hypothetical protein RL653_1478 [Pseudomonadota bacterium]